MLLPTEQNEQAETKEYWEAINDKLIVKPFAAVEKTASGIYLPPQAQEKQQQGTVISAGPGRYESGFFVKNSIKAGDVVLYHKHAGYDFKFDGQDVVLIAENAVQAILRRSKVETEKTLEPGDSLEPQE